MRPSTPSPSAVPGSARALRIWGASEEDGGAGEARVGAGPAHRWSRTEQVPSSLGVSRARAVSRVPPPATTSPQNFVNSRAPPVPLPGMGRECRSGPQRARRSTAAGALPCPRLDCRRSSQHPRSAKGKGKAWLSQHPLCSVRVHPPRREVTPAQVQGYLAPLPLGIPTPPSSLTTRSL